jgi:hypothetical protein
MDPLLLSGVFKSLSFCLDTLLQKDSSEGHLAWLVKEFLLQVMR